MKKYLVVLAALVAVTIGTIGCTMPTGYAQGTPEAQTPDPAAKPADPANTQPAPRTATGPSTSPIGERVSFIEGTLAAWTGRCWQQCPPVAAQATQTQTPAQRASAAARAKAKAAASAKAKATADTKAATPAVLQAGGATYTCKMEITGVTGEAAADAAKRVNYVECGPKGTTTPTVAPPTAAAATPPVTTVRIEVDRPTSVYDTLGKIPGPRYRGQGRAPIPPPQVEEHFEQQREQKREPFFVEPKAPRCGPGSGRRGRC